MSNQEFLFKNLIFD